MKSENNRVAIILESVELACLIAARPAKQVSHLALKGLGGFSPQEMGAARKTLEASGLLNQEGQLTTQILPLIDAIFFPERLLDVVRDVPVMGRQELIFLTRQGVMVLYTRPEQDKHRFEIIQKPENVPSSLKDFFQLGNKSTGERFTISPSLVEYLPIKVVSGDIQDAWQALKNVQCDPVEKEMLLRSFRHPTISGTLALLHMKDDGQVEDGYSLAMLGDEQSSWIFHQPSLDGESMVAQRNDLLLSRIMDMISQRFAGGTMLNSPLEETKIVSFSLNADEFAFCFTVFDRKDVAFNIMSTHFPGKGDIQPEFDRAMQQASDQLVARGWCQVNQQGQVVLAHRLASAISAIAQYTYVMQTSINRSNGSANATIHVVGDKLFTSVIRSAQDVYNLEHGVFSTLPRYFLQLFLDFGQDKAREELIEEKVSYNTLALALAEDKSGPAGRILIQAGMKDKIANLLGHDITDMVYQGTIIRINADSRASQEAIDASVKPVMLLLRGRQRSWMYHFIPTDDIGSLKLVSNRLEFLEEITDFAA